MTIGLDAVNSYSPGRSNSELTTKKAIMPAAITAQVATVRHRTSVPVNSQIASSEASTATRMHALVVQKAIFLTPPGLR